MRARAIEAERPLPDAEVDSRSRSLPRHLPLQQTPLVGRENELKIIRRMVLDPGVHLLTLTGPGGTGKTRLALEAAGQLVDSFRDGVHFVSLGAIIEPSLVPSAIAQVLGVVEVSGQSLVESLQVRLRDGQALLVLDSFEHILEAAPLVSDLLSACAGLKVLATSRATLRLRGEREFPVPPLGVPDPTDLPTLDLLRCFEAVELFVQRGRGARPDFDLDASNAESVAQICARLDGLPLAIELAAARVKVLTPEELLTRLGRRLDFLTGGARDLPARQRTVRGTIDWSYNLLDEGEQVLFRRVGVFAGGWTLDAAEAICAPGMELDVVVGLSGLVDQSLVQRQEESRFFVLETIREYALEKLEESGEIQELRRLHATYFLRLAEVAEPQLRASQQVAWLDRLEADHDNLRAALSWLLEHGKGEEAVRLASAVWRFWEMHGHLSEGRLWLERGLERGGDLSPPVQAEALNGAGHLAWLQGDHARATELLEASLTLQRAVGHTQHLAYTLNNLGLVALDQGDFTRATSLLTESLELRRQAGDEWGVALSLNNLGYAALLEGDLASAESLSAESASRFRDLDNSWGTALALTNLGRSLLERHEHARAADVLGECLTLSQGLGEKVFIAECLEGLAGLAAAETQIERAACLWGAAEALREMIQAPLSSAERSHYERHLLEAQG